MLRLVTCLLWALAAASAVYWGLRVGDSTQAVILPIATSPAFTGDASARQVGMARLLGAQPMAPAAEGPGPAERFALLGVISSLAGQGAALISVDGRPARPFVVGAQIAPGYLLKAVGPREATLAENLLTPARLILSLPPQLAGVATASPAAFALVTTQVVKERITGTGPPARADARRRFP